MREDGRIIVGKYAAVSSPANVTQVVPPDRRGAYRVHDYTIEFTWDSGGTAKTSFVYSEQDPGAIYVNGFGFIKRD